MIQMIVRGPGMMKAIAVKLFVAQKHLHISWEDLARGGLIAGAYQEVATLHRKIFVAKTAQKQAGPSRVVMIFNEKHFRSLE